MKKYSSEIIKLYIALLFTVYLLYYSDNYTAILWDKTSLFYGHTIGLAVFFTPFLIYSLISKKRDSAAVFDKKRMSLVEIFLMAFSFIALLSTVFSNDVKAAFLGDKAWYVGSLLILVCMLVFFIVSRFFNTKQKDIWIYLYCASFTVILLSILDRIGIDTLDIFQEVLWEYDIFTSTIGNVNFYSTLLSMVVPIFMMVAITSEKSFERIMSYLLCFMAYISIFILLANTAFLSIGLATIVILYFAIKDFKKIGRFAGLGLAFSLAGLMAKYLKAKEFVRPIDQDTAAKMILENNLHIVIGIISIVVIALSEILLTKKNEKCKKIIGIIEKKVSDTYMIFCGIAILGLLVARFSHPTYEMGNYRGYIWYVCLLGYKDLHFLNKLVGVGPGLIDSVMLPVIQSGKLSLTRELIYETAHSELIEYLVTTGILGVTAYYGMLVAVVVKGINQIRNKANEKSIMVFMGLLGYIVQSFVIGPYAFNVVLFFVFMGLWRAYSLQGE